jgi:hypothetical protein
MVFMLKHRRRYINPVIAAGVEKRASGGPARVSWWSKLWPLLFEKVFLALTVAVSIFFFQGLMHRSEEQGEKARHISEILVDKPVSIVADLPAHLDAFILYAEHIRSNDLEEISSARLTELQAAIRSDIEGSRAYYPDDPDLKLWAVQIKETVKAVRAKALSKSSLGREDLEKLEETRNLAYLFHHQVIELSVQEALKPFEAVGKRRHPR